MVIPLELLGSRCLSMLSIAQPWVQWLQVCPLGTCPCPWAGTRLAAAHVAWNDCSFCCIGVFCFLILTPVLSLGWDLFIPLAPSNTMSKHSLFFSLARWGSSSFDMFSHSGVWGSVLASVAAEASSGSMGRDPQRECLCSAFLEWEFQQHFEN